MSALLIDDAARALRVSTRTLERWLADGAPTVRRGARGRGHSHLIDLDALRAWRRAREAPEPADRLLAFAAEIPQIVGAAVYGSFTAIEDAPHKRACAPVLAAVGFSVIVSLLDRLRRDAAGTPELEVLPVELEALRRVGF